MAQMLFCLVFYQTMLSQVLHDATPADLEAALETLINIDAVTVTGSAGSGSEYTWSVTFDGLGVSGNMPLLTTGENDDGIYEVVKLDFFVCCLCSSTNCIHFV